MVAKGGYRVSEPAWRASYRSHPDHCIREHMRRSDRPSIKCVYAKEAIGSITGGFVGESIEVHVTARHPRYQPRRNGR